MKLNFLRMFFMPYVPGGSCTATEECPAVDFPTIGPECNVSLAVGGINEYYVIPCTEDFSEANVTSAEWWQGLVDGNKLGRSGIILGSIAKLTDKKERVGSCRTEELVSVTWGFKFQKKSMDKTAARKTVAQMNALILNANKFFLVLRMCEGDEQILPVGIFNTNDFNWTVPDNFEEIQVIEATLAWKELALPETVDVAGLNAVVQKLS